MMIDGVGWSIRRRRRRRNLLMNFRSPSKSKNLRIFSVQKNDNFWCP
jgi:hypothetical protein